MREREEARNRHSTLIYDGSGMMGNRDEGMLGGGERETEVMWCLGDAGEEDSDGGRGGGIDEGIGKE